MLFVALILIISLHSFDCVFTAQETRDAERECKKHCEGNNEYVTRYCGGLCSSNTGPQTFYCYLGCSHNASTQDDFDKCLPKCNDRVQLTEENCRDDCGRVTSHHELCGDVCGGNHGGSFPLCLYNCDQEHPREYERGYDKCKTKCYAMEGR
uniref:MEG 3.1 isoform 1 n=1 Tax=Schistosoma mansoni TaxID=6183 RepID=D7PD49_SCHMA|nr:MEG 3.1 isoform 1 [Schistosoma mansoni]